MTIETNLNNINFMSQNQYDSLAEKNDNELYAVDVTDKFVATDTKQDISGVKTFTGSGTVNIKTDSVQNTAPSNTLYRSINWLDVNDEGVGHVEYVDSASIRGINIGVKDYSGNNHGLEMVFSKAQNRAWMTVPACKDITNGVVTQTGWNYAQNGFFKYGNGMVVQWGNVNVPGNGAATVTLPTAFASKNYVVISSTGSAGSLGMSTGITYAGNKNTTSFTLDFPDAGTAGYVYWFAIGY